MQESTTTIRCTTFGSVWSVTVWFLKTAESIVVTSNHTSRRCPENSLLHALYTQYNDSLSPPSIAPYSKLLSIDQEWIHNRQGLNEVIILTARLKLILLIRMSGESAQIWTFKLPSLWQTTTSRWQPWRVRRFHPCLMHIKRKESDSVGSTYNVNYYSETMQERAFNNKNPLNYGLECRISPFKRNE